MENLNNIVQGDQSLGTQSHDEILMLWSVLLHHQVIIVINSQLLCSPAELFKFNQYIKNVSLIWHPTIQQKLILKLSSCSNNFDFKTT